MTTAIAPQSTLPELADAINREHQAAIDHAQRAVEHALKCGRLLIQAKGKLLHGEFLPWLSKHCHVKERQAQNYMRVAKNWPAIAAKNAPGADLTIRGALALLEGPRPEPYDVDCVLADVPPEKRKRLSKDWHWLAKHVLLFDTAGWDALRIAEHVQSDVAIVDLVLSPRPPARDTTELVKLFKGNSRIVAHYDGCVRYWIHAFLEASCSEASQGAFEHGLSDIAAALERRRDEHARRKQSFPIIIPVGNAFLFSVIGNCVIADAWAATGYLPEERKTWQWSFGFMFGDIANELTKQVQRVVIEGRGERIEHAREMWDCIQRLGA